MPTDLRPEGTPTSHKSVNAVAPDQISDGSVVAPNGRPPASAVRLARTAGLLYLAVAILGGFAQFVRVSVYAPGDAAATTANIVANQTLIRFSFAADLVQAMVWLVMAVVLYRLMSHAGRNLARAMVVFVAVSAAIATLNMVHQIGALLVATAPSYAAALRCRRGPRAGPAPDGSAALRVPDRPVVLAVALRPRSARLRSGLFPKWLSVLLMTATVCYVADSLTRFTAPALADTSAAVFLLPEILCEVALLAYLLIKGVRTPQVAGRTASTR